MVDDLLNMRAAYLRYAYTLTFVWLLFNNTQTILEY